MTTLLVAVRSVRDNASSSREEVGLQKKKKVENLNQKNLPEITHHCIHTYILNEERTKTKERLD